MYVVGAYFSQPESKKPVSMAQSDEYLTNDHSSVEIMKYFLRSLSLSFPD